MSKNRKLGNKKYLVIKHGALGDFIMATGPFAAIRKRHPAGHIVLLTTKTYAGLAEDSGYFDEIWIDEKPGPFDFKEGLELIKKLRQANFQMVYDLQTSDRSDWYFRLMGRKKPMWSGRIDWCSHPHLNPERTKMHTLERQAEQLNIAGIKKVPKPDISWLKSNISKFRLTKKPYALLVPGGSAHRPEKRWTKEGYAAIARYLHNKGVIPVFIGAEAEAEDIKEVIKLSGDAVNLVGKTSFADIAALARKAKIAIGNDTGPMHIISFAGCPTIVLFSEHSSPDKIRPRGEKTRILFEEDLDFLEPSDVVSLMEEMVSLSKKSKKR